MDEDEKKPVRRIAVHRLAPWPSEVHFLLGIMLVGLSALAAQGGVPSGYYDRALGKSGAELRWALHVIIRNHRVIPYSEATQLDTSDALKRLEEDPADTNLVRLVYSGLSMPKAEFGKVTGWNREHLWPNSYGLDDVEPAFSDLHNLRAVDATVNSSRGNKWFDRSDVGDSKYSTPAHEEAPWSSSDSDSWEPGDEEKGDLARAMFYMAVRYTGDKVGEPRLVMTDRIEEVTSSTNLMARLSTLLLWHLSDPVDERERWRNELVFVLYQGNRNPFIDHPEWVTAAFGPRLEILRTSEGVKLSWQPEFTLPELQSAPAIDGPWEQLGVLRQNPAVPPQVTGDLRFFRIIAR